VSIFTKHAPSDPKGVKEKKKKKGADEFGTRGKIQLTTCVASGKV
jgi:hypothetical protein